MLESLELFRIAGARMRHLGTRQAIISKNIANADTPRYRAADASPFRFESALIRGGHGRAGEASPLQATATSPGHLSPATNRYAVRIDRRDAATEKPNGNTVSLEDQMIKASDVASNYDLVTSAYRKSASLLKTAITGGRG